MARSRNRSVFAQGSSAGVGSRLIRVVLVLALLIIIGGAVMLGFGDIEPPAATVEKTIPDEDLPR